MESAVADGQLNYAEFKDASGNVIAYYYNGGWNQYSTDAEEARIHEFLPIYNDVWRAEYKGRMSAIQNSEGMLDIKV
jgi:hypothetical protein